MTVYAFTKHHEITFKILCILKGSYPRNWLGSCNILKDLTWYPVQDLKHLLGSCPRSWLGSLKSFRILCKILRTFALIVCAQPFCAGNATAICHASLRLTGPEDKHGVENTGEKNFRPSLLLWIIGDPYFFNHESLTLLTIYKI